MSERENLYTTSLATGDAAVNLSQESGSTPQRELWYRAIHHRSFIVGSVLTILLAAIAIVSLFWTPHDPTQINISHRLAGPSLEHWLGADQFGRDILSIIMAGAQNSIMVGVVAVGIGMSFGVTLGLIASSNRGWVEELIMRSCDFM